MNDVNNLAAAKPTIWAWIVGIGGGITAIAAAVAVIRKPWKDMLSRVDALERKHAADQSATDTRLAADLELLNEMNGTIKHLNYGVFVLLDHAATGNSVERCKEARDKLERHSSGM